MFPALKLQSQVQGPVNPSQPNVRLSPRWLPPSQVLSWNIPSRPSQLQIRQAPPPPPGHPGWLPIHTFNVCLLSVFRSPLNGVLAGQTYSTRPKTRQEEKVIEFPTSCQTHRKSLEFSGAATKKKKNPCRLTAEDSGACKLVFRYAHGAQLHTKLLGGSGGMGGLPFLMCIMMIIRSFLSCIWEETELAFCLHEGLTPALNLLGLTVFFWWGGLL